MKKAEEEGQEGDQQRRTYERVFTGGNETHKSDRPDSLHSHKGDLEKALPTKGILVRDTRGSTVGLNEIKLDDPDTDKDHGDEDVDFQGLGLRKYLEKQNIISVERPDYGADKMGKRSKLDYVKDLAYFNEEMKKYGDKDIIKQSERRLLHKEIEERAREEVKKQLQEEGEGEEESLYIDKQEDSFERKKTRIRDLMCKNKENTLLPPLNERKQDKDSNNNETHKRMPKEAQIKEHFYVPPEYKLNQKPTREKEGSRDSTKHSSADRGHTSDESFPNHRNQAESQFKRNHENRKDESITQESYDEGKHSKSKYPNPKIYQIFKINLNHKITFE